MIPRATHARHADTVQRCDHPGPMVRVKGEATDRFAAHCSVCGTIGPSRLTPETAHKALVVLGARNQA
jgi:hypothetical protein